MAAEKNMGRRRRRQRAHQDCFDGRNVSVTMYIGYGGSMSSCDGLATLYVSNREEKRARTVSAVSPWRKGQQRDCPRWRGSKRQLQRRWPVRLRGEIQTAAGRAQDGAAVPGLGIYETGLLEAQGKATLGDLRLSATESGLVTWGRRKAWPAGPGCRWARKERRGTLRALLAAKLGRRGDLG